MKKFAEDEALAEPLGRKLLIQKGSAGASPSHGAANQNFFTAPEDAGSSVRVASGPALPASGSLPIIPSV